MRYILPKISSFSYLFFKGLVGTRRVRRLLRLMGLMAVYPAWGEYLQQLIAG